VAIGRRNGRHKNKTRLHLVKPTPATLSEAENQSPPATLSEATRSGYLVKPLSRSRVGSRSPDRYLKARATQPYAGYSSLPLELRLLALGLGVPQNLARAP
jgi:hypothetical protein